MVEPTPGSTMKSLALVVTVLAIGCHADPLIFTTASNVMTGLLGNVLPSSASSSAPEVQSTTCECGASRGSDVRIINGLRTPWEGAVTVTAQIVNKTTNQMHTSGSLITPRHVLTVAHSHMDVSPDAIYVGVGNPYNEYRTGKVGEYTQKVEVEQILLHGYTGPPARYNDIAIVVLKSAVQLNQYVRVACLPKDNSDDLASQTALIAGWGYIRNDSNALAEEIRSAKVKILSTEQCHNAWSAVPAENPKQFCVDSPFQRAAQGDSGSPVQWYDESIQRYVDVGIVSYGALNRDRHYPRVNTKVSEYLDWIKSVVNSTSEDQICTKQ